MVRLLSKAVNRPNAGITLLPPVAIRRRLNRAMAITEMTGKPLPTETKRPDYDFRCFYLTAPRLNLVAMLEERCEDMILQGLVEETIGLMAEKQLEPWTSGARAIGYRQAIEYITREWMTQDTRSEQGRRRKFIQFLYRYQAAMRQFARKQQMWFRNKEPDYWWLIRNQEDDAQILAERISEKYATAHWEVPSADICQKRAEADLLSNKKISPQMYLSDARCVLFADQGAIDSKLAAIRENLSEAFPELCEQLEHEATTIKEKEELRVRRAPRVYSGSGHSGSGDWKSVK